MNEHDLFIIKLKNPLSKGDFAMLMKYSSDYSFNVNKIDVETWYIDCGKKTTLSPKNVLYWFPEGKISRIVKISKTVDMIIKF